jgi:hypothetical protein
MDWTGPLVEALRDDPTTAIYIRSGYPNATISVFFEDDFISIGGLGEAGVGGGILTAVCFTSDMPYAARGDQLRIGGTVYYVTEVRPDGKGITTLFLSKDP